MKQLSTSVKVLLLLIIASLFAEIICNDRPIFMMFKGKAYFPTLSNVREIDIGGDYLSSPDYADPSIIKLINKNGYMVMPPIPYSYGTIDYLLEAPAPSKPSARHILGTDDHGRDILARLLYGLRLSLIFGILLTFFSSVIGIFLGAIQGYYGGILDILLQRFIEIWLGLPLLYMLIVMSSVLIPSFSLLLFIMILFGWTSLVPLVRAEFLKARNYDYVKAAKVLGISPLRIILKHILPNAMVASLSMIPFILSASVTTLTALDFLGLGLPLGSPSLGEMLSQAKGNLQAYWISIPVFSVLILILTLLIFVGQEIRDKLDPRS
ncbi:MAG: ABC transporter permease [Rickettsiales bacterium]